MKKLMDKEMDTVSGGTFSDDDMEKAIEEAEKVLRRPDRNTDKPHVYHTGIDTEPFIAKEI